MSQDADNDGAEVRAALAPLPPGYRDLFARLAAVAGADERIRALWLSGSLGRRAADAGSDLDVVLAVGADDFEEFTDGWRDWLATVTPTVLARPVPGLRGCWFSLTPQCLRLDIVAERAGTASPAARARRVLVLDKDGAYAGLPRPPAEPGRGPDPARLTALTEEFFRQQAIFPAAVVARGDWLLGVVGVQATAQLLYDLFVESNQPLPPMGVKQWSARLTPAQRETCAALPQPAADPASVLAAMKETAAQFRAAAGPILAAAGATWPGELEAAVQGYLAAELGWPA